MVEKSGAGQNHVMASLAEIERDLTIERTQAGLKIDRQLGRVAGRRRQMTDTKIKSAKKLLAFGPCACVLRLVAASPSFVTIV